MVWMGKVIQQPVQRVFSSPVQLVPPIGRCRSREITIDYDHPEHQECNPYLLPPFALALFCPGLLCFSSSGSAL